jgi:hypothetical protein
MPLDALIAQINSVKLTLSSLSQRLGVRVLPLLFRFLHV